MQPYNKAFGTCAMKPNAAGKVVETCAVTALQQSLISVTFLFVALGGATAGITGSYFGRRGTIQVGCLLVAIGAGSMLGTSGNFTAYMVCKCIGGVGLGHIIAAAPIYGAECTAASKRGMLMALYNIGLGMGNAIAAAVCLGSSAYTTNLAWQIPIICQIPLAAILGLGVMMFPESPRWLLNKGREEAARKSFARFYEKDPQSLEISRQVQEVQYYIELEKATGTTTNWTEIFRANDIRRTITSALILIGLAITGSKFVVPYAAIFLAGVGISNPFLINFIVALCIFVGSVPGPWIVEYGGRRFSMLTGYGCMASCMLIISAVASGLGSQGAVAKTVLVVFLCLWAVIFGAFIGTSVWIAAPEMHSVRLRTYGQACTTTFYQIFGFAASFYSPYMLSAQYGNMGLNVGYFYFGKAHSKSSWP
jgi:SP family sugar:H+ symporter-like MFS transporter